MLPVNSRHLILNFYFNATKRCLFKQNATRDHKFSSTISFSETLLRNLNQNSKFSSNANRRPLKKTNLPPEDDKVVRYRQAQLVTSYFQQQPNYCQMVREAKERARRSILIDHCGLKHIDLKTEFENVEHVYTILRETAIENSKLTLIEFKTEQDADNVARQVEHNCGLLPVALKIFKYVHHEKDKALQSGPRNLNFKMEYIRLSYKNELSTDFNNYKELLSNNMMTLVALKLRFVTLVNFERILCSGIFEEYEILPFGSSVLDLGSNDGDLDLIVARKVNQLSTTGVKKENQMKKLIHLDKSLYQEVNDRNGVRAAMRYFENILRDYMPLTDGFAVQSIRSARVPIIKFKSRITSIDCDLSFDLDLENEGSNLESTKASGAFMAELLYSLCRSNNLIPAFGIYLKLYAKLSGITTKEVNLGLTNFQYLSLILFYLQQITVEDSGCDREVINLGSSDLSMKSKRVVPSGPNSKSIVPPFKDLFEPEKRAQMILNPIHFSDHEIESILPVIIGDFWNYYAEFDFSKNSLDLYDGKLERKLDNSTIYVRNPLEQSRNVCHNVTRRGLDTFVSNCKSAKVEMNFSKVSKNPLSLIKALIAMEQDKTSKKTPDRRSPVVSYNVS